MLRHVIFLGVFFAMSVQQNDHSVRLMALLQGAMHIDSSTH